MGPIFKRVVLKLSGEALSGEGGFGIHPERVRELAVHINEIRELGVELAIVLGGGNFFRGISESAHGMDRVAADQMGMLATIINGLALQDALEKLGCFTRLMAAIEMPQVAEPVIRRRAIRHLEKGRIVIFAAGTGNPYFSTDTAAALRAMEIKAEAVLKGTKVEGIFDADPAKVKDAKLFPEISYLEVIARGLGVMDSTAISLCRDHSMPIVVFNLHPPSNLRRVVLGEKVGSLVS